MVGKDLANEGLITSMEEAIRLNACAAMKLPSSNRWPVC